MDIKKELGVSSIQEKVREIRLRWYGHMQRMEENNEVRAVGGMRGPGKRPRGDQEGDGGMASEGIRSRYCGSPRRMHRTEHSGNQDFWPLTPYSGKRQRRRRRRRHDIHSEVGYSYERGENSPNIMLPTKSEEKAADTFRLRAAHCRNKFNQRITYKNT